MSSIVFVNGSFLPFEEASIPIMDRGFLFADGIYEVSAVLNARLVDNDAHLARLDRSLDQIRIANPYTAQEWTRLEEELVRRNGLVEGVVYMEVTRGAAERDFAFPKDAKPTVVMFTQVKNITRAPAAETGVAVVTVEDLRWKRRDIKSVALLAQVLAKQAAAEAGVFEAWMVEDGHVTEGSSSTAFIITRDGRIVDPAFVERDPARHHATVGDAACAGAWAQGRGAPVHDRGGACGGRGLPHQRLELRDAGGRDRRQAGRQRPPGRADPAPAPALSRDGRRSGQGGLILISRAGCPGRPRG